MAVWRGPFDKVIGTGGIGSGVLFALDGNQTLGRNESRMAHRLDSRDYCKQHIILHCIAVLAKALPQSVTVLPVGAVGADEAGSILLGEMAAAGLDTRYVRTIPDAPTLTCVAFVYPDGSGGNVTESRSASARLRPDDVTVAAAELRSSQNRGVIVAAPEVPIECRIRLLDIGRQHGAFNVASFVSDETPVLRQRPDLLRLIDLLALNLDEAAALAGLPPGTPADTVAGACGQWLAAAPSAVLLAVTDGARGSYCCQGGEVEHLPAINVEARATAGAGDAFLAGLILGVLAGYPFQGKGEHTAHRIARLLAAMSVQSPHTINFEIAPCTLQAFAAAHGEAALARDLFARPSRT